MSHTLPLRVSLPLIHLRSATLDGHRLVLTGKADFFLIALSRASLPALPCADQHGFPAGLSHPSRTVAALSHLLARVQTVLIHANPTSSRWARYLFLHKETNEGLLAQGIGKVLHEVACFLSFYFFHFSNPGMAFLVDVVEGTLAPVCRQATYFGWCFSGLRLF